MNRARETKRLRALYLHDTDLAEIEQHAEAAYPDECCGVLVGRQDETGVFVNEVFATPNAHLDAGNGFEIPAESLVEIMTAARVAGSEVVGYYHSHPDQEAKPSSTDERDGWPQVSYLIVEVTDGIAGRSTSWRLDEAGCFVGETLASLTPSEAPGASRR